MARVDWKQILDDDFRVPTGHQLGDLTAELTALLGDPDPAHRERLATTTLVTWVGRGVFDDLLPGLGDGMVAGLRVGVGAQGTDEVFRRGASAVVLAACIARDTTRPLVPGGKVLEWGDRLAAWLLDEQDLRGWVAGKGWARAVAHGADAVGALAGSPHLSGGELTVLLDVLGERVRRPAPHRWAADEPDHLAGATLAVLRRDRVPFDLVESWLGTLVDVRGEVETGSVDSLGTGAHRPDPRLLAGSLDAYLRALYLQLALGPRPPGVRADLLLLLVDALRSLSPRFLAP